MPNLSTADHTVSPPIVTIPREYNAAHDLIERNLAAGRAEDRLHRRRGRDHLWRTGRAREPFRQRAPSLGLEMESRVLLCHLDTIDLPIVFLGAIKAGIVPVAVNTLLTTQITNSC